MTDLILLRHGQSQWNAENRFTGWAEVPLSPRGEEDARTAAKKLVGRKIDKLHTSSMQRAIQTADIVLSELGMNGVPTERSAALNERNYGDLQGMNKDEIRRKYGEEQFMQWRRSFEGRPPNGESLSDTSERVLPYWRSNILPDIAAGSNVLVVAHGNSIRALVKHLDGLSKEAVAKLEIPWDAPLFYESSETVDGLFITKNYI
ncbi:MAG: 2,3-diphosphoglycerate-dependent phosphoglycerate mutase [Candidatus Aenigmatarchaeota archaeon]|nr:MAG: 2,3-diphosphoglycerate-dependent phosphoglycerate mutase [Candidatus Aenigmarchaeota archaeon]